MNARVLLYGGIALPILYFATQVVALLLNPAFDVARQQPSELGCCGAYAPMVANLGFIAAGVSAIVGGVGLALMRKAGGGVNILAILSGLCLALFGVAMAMSGLFPLPNPLHYGFGLYPAALGAPLFGAFAVGKGGAARWIVLAGCAATVAIVAVASGVGGLASADNAGLFSRAASVVLFPTIALLCMGVRDNARA